MAKEYDTFVETLDDLKEGEEIELTIRDLETYEAKKVKAVVFSSKEKLPDGDTLWIRFSRGTPHKEPWAIKITEELPSFLT
jgi:hypothetical protein